MIAFEAAPRAVKVVTCDRCGQALREDRPFEGYSNRTQIRFRAGYGSLFGDGNKIEGDLCDRCLYELLGPYLRIVAPSPAEARAAGDDPGSPLEASSTTRRAASTRHTRRRGPWRRTWPSRCVNGSTPAST